MSVIREVGASGAYWVASATDTIVANELSVTGSIGVIASYLDFSGFIEDYNVTYQRLVSGQFKDSGSRFKELTPTERQIKQQQIDKVHDIFIKSVAEGRGVPETQIRQYAQGQVFLGTEAIEIGLIDEIGTKDDAVKMLEEQLGIEAELLEFKQPTSIFGPLVSVMDSFSFRMGEGFASQTFKQHQSGIFT